MALSETPFARITPQLPQHDKRTEAEHYWTRAGALPSDSDDDPDTEQPICGSAVYVPSGHCEPHRLSCHCANLKYSATVARLPGP